MAMLFEGAAASDNQTDNVYYPKLPPGITTIEAAKDDLATLFKTKAKFCIKYGETNYRATARDVEDEKKKVKERISHLDWTSFQVDDRYGEMQVWTRSIPVYSDRIDIPFFPLFYEDLLEFDIAIDNHEIKLPSHVKLEFINAETERIADDLFFIQQALKKKQDEQLTLFKSKAAQYRTQKVKPVISEEQRKFIVQAKVANQQKDYTTAIDLYKKAIELDPVSNPGVYFNAALLYAQMQKFNNAIFIMKQYLMFEPESQEARIAQDKIYEWEFMMKKNRSEDNSHASLEINR
jgi:tetratricopeptide (TPR) repeat protein